MKDKIKVLPCEEKNCQESIKASLWLMRRYQFGFGVCDKHLIELFQEEILLQNLEKLNER